MELYPVLLALLLLEVLWNVCPASEWLTHANAWRKQKACFALSLTAVSVSWCVTLRRCCAVETPCQAVWQRSQILCQCSLSPFHALSITLLQLCYLYCGRSKEALHGANVVGTQMWSGVAKTPSPKHLVPTHIFPDQLYHWAMWLVYPGWLLVTFCASLPLVRSLDIRSTCEVWGEVAVCAVLLK
jgi:hypothetical protein